jgi:N-acetylneuraminic acid mutarotase
MKTNQTVIIFLGVLFSIALRSQVSWTQKTNFGGTARYGTVAFTVGTKAYVLAGRDFANRNDLWEYDPSKDTWTQKTAFAGAARYQAIAFTIGNKGYVGTGAAGSSFPFSPVFNDLWEYDPALDSWTQKANCPGSARFGAVAFAVGGKAYVGTGFTDNFPYFLNDFWEFNPAGLSNGLDIHGNPMGEWTQKNNFGGSARMEAVAFSIGDKGYLGTGGNYMSSTLLYNDFWEYDAVADLWTQKTNFGGTGRSLAVGFSMSNKGYIGIGGDFNSQSYPDFWEFDPTDISNGLDGNNNPMGAWVTIANFGGASRWLASAFSIVDTGYVATGGNFTPTYNDLWAYGPAPSPPDLTGIKNNVTGNTITVIPRIGEGEFKVLGPENTIRKINVYCVTGEKIYSTVTNSRVLTLDLSPFTDGIYVIQVETGTQLTRNKIIIAKP